MKEDRKDFEIFINRKNKDGGYQGRLRTRRVGGFSDAVSRRRLQDEYNQEIRNCDLFVMLFWTKVGNYTEEEFETAVGQFKATEGPFIFTYFKDDETTRVTPNEEDIKSLNAFKSKLHLLGRLSTPGTETLLSCSFISVSNWTSSLQTGSSNSNRPRRRPPSGDP